MSLLNPSPYISREDILQKSDGGKLVFIYYFHDYDFNNPKAYIQLRAEDKTPSTRISLFNGEYRITDYGNQSEVNSLNAIQFVMYKEGVDFKTALHFINNSILKESTNSSASSRQKHQADYSYREKSADDVIGEYRFKYKETPSQNDLQSIGRYITPDLLETYRCYAVEEYEYCSRSKKLDQDIVHKYKSNDDYPIFVFDYGDFKKLYRPRELYKQYRFTYIGKKPDDYIFGFEVIQNANNEFLDPVTGDLNTPEYKPEAIVKDLYRCSGESDALNLTSLGLHAYWLNSETANLSYDQWKSVDDLCQNHYQVMDLDKTGQQEAHKLALKHIALYTIYLPQWLPERRDWRGNPCKDLKDFINISGEKIEETLYNFTVLKRKALQIKFWNRDVNERSGKISYSLNLEFLYHFLKVCGFYAMDSIYHRKANYCYAKVDGKIIDLINPDDIKRIVKRHIKDWIRSKNLSDEIAILNKLNSSNQISEANLQDLSKIDPVFTNCSANDEYIIFKNGGFHITKDEIHKIQLEEVPNNILGNIEVNGKNISHLIPKFIPASNFPLVEVYPTADYQILLDDLEETTDDNERLIITTQIARYSEIEKYQIKINDLDFIFIKFIQDLAHIHWRKEEEQGLPLSEDEIKEEKLVFINLLFALGYCISEYKDPGKPWLVFLQDMKISQVGKSSGRSGKSLFSKAIEYVRPSFYVAGRHKKITEKPDFIYDGFTIFHNNIEIDDLSEFADFGFFYTQVTGKREVNSKFISKQILEYPDSGKMLISSNFELQNSDSSTLARILNAGVSDYYHEKTKHNDYLQTRSPLSKYGRRLYDDFTDAEWSKFYNLAAYCIQLQQRFDKIEPPMGNLEKRQLRREMAKGLGHDEEFLIWARSYFHNAPSNYTSEFSPDDDQIGYFNAYVLKQKSFEDFTSTLTKATASRYKQTQFKTALKSFCEYYGYELNPIHLCGSNKANIEGRRIVKTISGKSVEVFYISTLPEILEPDSPDPGIVTSEEIPF